MATPKGVSGNPNGRPKGTPNKVTATIREDVLKVYVRMGGVDGLEKWAKESMRNRSAFYGWVVSKLLPALQDVKIGNLDEDGFKVVVEKVITDKRPSEGAEE